MGRTLPSFSQVFQMEEKALAGFRKTLRAADQRAFDELMDLAFHHTHAMAYAAHPLPLEMILLAMLLEDHKEVMRLREKLGIQD